MDPKVQLDPKENRYFVRPWSLLMNHTSSRLMVTLISF